MKPGYKQTEVGVIPEEASGLDNEWRMCRRRIDALVADPDFTGGEFLTGFKIAYSHAKPRDPHVHDGIDQKLLGKIAMLHYEIVSRGQELVQLHLLRDHSDPSTRQAYPQDAAPLISDLRKLVERMEIHAASLRPHVPRKHQTAMDEPLAAFSELARSLIEVLEESADCARKIEALENSTQDGRRPMKPGYKQTEVGVIPEEWEIRQCSEISERIMVGIVIRPTQYYVPHGVPALRSANIREDGITDSDLVFISEASNALLAKSQTRTGDILTVRTGYPGTSAVVRSIHAGCNCIDILITRPSKKVDSDFLATWINSCFGKEQVLRNQGGLAQKHFNVSDMRNLVVALPPLPEQRAIAAALLDVDALLATLDRHITKKRDLKQAAMQQLLTGQTRLPGFEAEWETIRLGELFTFKNGLNKAKQFFGFGSPIVNYMDVFGSSVMFAANLAGKVSLSPAEIRNFDVRKGDVFFTRTSETPEEVGTASVMLDEPSDTVFSGFVLRARPRDTKLDDGFKAYCFRAQSVRQQIVAGASYTTRALTNGRLLSSVTLALPPKSEQTAIATVLSDMDTELAALEQRREKTRALKQGMMQELLTGKTRLIKMP